MLAHAVQPAGAAALCAPSQPESQTVEMVTLRVTSRQFALSYLCRCLAGFSGSPLFRVSRAPALSFPASNRAAQPRIVATPKTPGNEVGAGCPPTTGPRSVPDLRAIGPCSVRSSPAGVPGRVLLNERQESCQSCPAALRMARDNARMSVSFLPFARVPSACAAATACRCKRAIPGAGRSGVGTVAACWRFA